MNKTLAIASTMILSVAILAGCSTTPTATPTQPPVATTQPAVPQVTPNQQFLADANNSGTKYDNLLPDQTLLDYGHAICSEFDSGKSVNDVINEIANVAIADNLDQEGAQYMGFVAGVAVKNFCPKYASEIQAAIGA